MIVQLVQLRRLIVRSSIAIVQCVVAGDGRVGAGAGWRGQRPVPGPGQVEQPAKQPPEAGHQQDGLTATIQVSCDGTIMNL